MRALPTSAIGTSLLAFATSFGTAPAHADTLLGIDFSGTAWFIDAQTGASGAPTPNPFSQTNAMARSPGNAYFSATSTQLVSLDPVTGAATGGPALTLGTQNVAITGMSYLGTSLYAVNHVPLDPQTSADHLWLIDPLTGLGSANVQLALSGVQALAAYGGTLYGWHPDLGLVTINPASGAVTDPFPLAGASNEIQTLAFDDAGSLYGAHSALYRVSLSDGSLAFVGQGGYGNLRGMEFVAVAPVPEPSAWLMLIAGLGVMGWTAMRRRSS